VSAAKMGAIVLYCGHAGWFTADIFLVEGVNIVKANGPVNGDNLVRTNLDTVPTHHLSDFPKAGCWIPERGVFVVPENQVTTINSTSSKRYEKRPKSRSAH